MIKKVIQKSNPYKTRPVDRLMGFTIISGGWFTVICILAIFVFLLFETLPLLTPVSKRQLLSWEIDKANKKVISARLSHEENLIQVLYSDGSLVLLDHSDGSVKMSIRIKLQNDERIVSVSHPFEKNNLLSVGTTNGRILQIQYKNLPDSITVKPVFESNEKDIFPEVKKRSINHMLYREIGETSCWYWIQEYRLFRKISSTFDSSESFQELSKVLSDEILTAIATTSVGLDLITGTLSGELYWFKNGILEDNWKVSNHKVEQLIFLAGDQTLIVADNFGQIHSWFRVAESRNRIRFKQIRTFQSHETSITELIPFNYNRIFLSLDINGQVKIHHSTTGKSHLLFHANDFSDLLSLFILDYNRLLFNQKSGKLSLYLLNNPFPEVTIPSLFGKVWYEGYSEPEFVWQSTGGSDVYESKFSLVPLLFGTIKGALYGLLFSIPLGLLSAIYISQFSQPAVSGLVKPMIEVLASFPSIVLGLIAGIFMAPFFSEYLMEIFIFLGVLPLLILMLIVITPKFSNFFPEKFSPGKEVIGAVFILALSIILSKLLSPLGEYLFFAGDFKSWLYQNFNIQYEQQNSILVGFALGLVVLPTIFTVSEDSLSRVPKSIISGALALGASHTQAVFRLVIPAAGSGILASIVLALGRAVGETMIFLMISGNTPIMNLSPFNGFRSISATIAIEMPEALPGSSLYHIIFLMGLLLFIFTFLLNFVSSVLSSKLRSKYSNFD